MGLTPGHPAALRGCEQLWACAVFELENIRGTKAFGSLHQQACRGELTRAQWIFENARLEYLASRRTAKLYESLWRPMTEDRGVLTDCNEWYVGGPETFEEVIAQYDDPNGWPWNFWGRYWDEEIEPFLKGRQRYDASRVQVSIVITFRAAAGIRRSAVNPLLPPA